MSFGTARRSGLEEEIKSMMEQAPPVDMFLLFDLSFRNRFSPNQIVQTVKVPVDLFIWTISRDPTHPLITMELGDKLIKFVKPIPGVPLVPAVPQEYLKEDGNCMEYTVKLPETGMKLLELVSNVILTFVEIKSFGVEIYNTDMINFKDFFISKITKEFHEVCLLLDGTNESRDIEKALHFFQEQATVRYFKLNYNLPTKVSYKGPLRGYCVKLKDAGFVSNESLLRLDCEKVVINREIINTKHLNGLLKIWANNGGLARLKMMTVIFKNCLNPEKLYHGLNSRPTQHPCPDFYKLGPESWTRFARDVYRGSGCPPGIAILVHERFYFWIP
ncbi:unnamed protein product [Caenorhabditis brenneri]